MAGSIILGFPWTTKFYATYHLMMTPSCEGVYNLTAPEPVTQKQYAKILGRVFAAPSFRSCSGFALKLMFGELAQALVLDGQRVFRRVLQESGYVFRHERLEPCLRRCLGKQKLT